jgi:hypothetical protein
VRGERQIVVGQSLEREVHVHHSHTRTETAVRCRPDAELPPRERVVQGEREAGVEGLLARDADVQVEPMPPISQIIDRVTSDADAHAGEPRRGGCGLKYTRAEDDRGDHHGAKTGE